MPPAPVLVVLGLLLAACGAEPSDCDDRVESLPENGRYGVTVRVQDHRLATFDALGGEWHASYVWSERKRQWVFGPGPQVPDGRYKGTVTFGLPHSGSVTSMGYVLSGIGDRVYRMEHVLQCPY